MDVLRQQAHHGAPGGVEGAGIGVGQADPDGCFGGGPDLVRGGHGLDPGDFGAAGLQALDLLGEGIDGFVVGQRAERYQQLAGRSDRAGHDHLAAGLVGDGAGDLGGTLVQLEDTVLRVVQLQAVAGAAEGVGEDNVGACLDEIPVQVRDRLGRGLVQQFRCLAGGQAHGEQVRAGGAVGQQHALFRDQRVDRIVRRHGRRPSFQFR